ncbi:hypothetical protein D7X99_41870, partial [Corallococcus sp. AB032C]
PRRLPRCAPTPASPPASPCPEASAANRSPGNPSRHIVGRTVTANGVRLRFAVGADVDYVARLVAALGR